MTKADLLALLPLIVLAGAGVIVMLQIAIHRSHLLTFIATLAGFGLAFVALYPASLYTPRQVTALVVIDRYALLYMGLMIAAGFSVTGMAYGYLRLRLFNVEEFYLLLLLATVGAAVLVASSHFASFFLGLEILSVSLYALIAYPRMRSISIEAGMKYLILAGVSSAFLVFGIALVYAVLGTMEFGRVVALVSRIHSGPGRSELFLGLALVIVGIGFKLAVVPFHQWTPDIYQGAPAPVTAYVATVSKGAMIGLVLRLFGNLAPSPSGVLFYVFCFISLASMVTGNLLALLQQNVKRLLAYSSIAHLGYMLVAFLAGGQTAVTAVTFYLIAYFVTSLGAFGVVSALSSTERDADKLEDYRGLARRHPALALVFTAMLLSLAGIPLTAGFIGKFYLVIAGVSASLWLLVVVLVLTTGVGLYYYLRVLVTMFLPSEEGAGPSPLARPLALSSGVVLGGLTLILIWIGVSPEPVINMIRAIAGGLL